MFDIGGFELLLIAVVGLLVIGPERLPETLRTLGLWLGRLRRSFTSVKAEIEKEIGMDEVRRQLHNEAVMDEMKRIETDVKSTLQEPVIDPSGNVPRPAATPGAAEAEAGESSDGDTPAAAGAAPADGPDPIEPPPPAPLPPSDAELEASYARKQAKLAAEKEKSGSSAPAEGGRQAAD